MGVKLPLSLLTSFRVVLWKIVIVEFSHISHIVILLSIVFVTSIWVAALCGSLIWFELGFCLFLGVEVRVEPDSLLLFVLADFCGFENVSHFIFLSVVVAVEVFFRITDGI